LEINKIYNGDCLELMQEIKDKSIDMILCDLPYGTTACKWDTIIPFEPLWEQYKRIIKDNGAIVLTACQPFTSMLVMSNIKMFKYEWIWEKTKATGFLDAKEKPLNNYESILVFSKKKPPYNPQMTEGKMHKRGGAGTGKGEVYSKFEKRTTTESNLYYPKRIINFKTEHGLHPTQKPVSLFEYLIKTYTNECDLVLDNCGGSGTTAIACLNTNRNYILMEKEKKYFDIINNRITEYMEKNHEQK
jgi:site-specific DNA-methyltransferase (adenine-specific)